ncbi:thin pili chaperone AcuD [Acinetobacter guillouiae]|uniref:fimbrial biogenesis chaperone n=1 Tax=Acinetobacter guillouiae TaxID=106649 RepID=UPI0004EF68C3|nr:molecular chaperone [Acinetobacter guillouiae]BAP36416.1 thin pili chaperone AcuD [Acinetobacter guillouiae]
MNIQQFFFKLIVLVACYISSATFAGVTITGTRIIFPSNQSSVTVQLNNPDDKPALVQAWLDSGDPKEIPKASEIPFILTPPLTQIPSKKGQMLRLITKDNSLLPNDRESLFWFNILDVAATEQEAGTEANKLQVSIRSRIKLIYRPQQIKISQDKAFSTTSFKYDDRTNILSISNPSPYYINFYNVTINTGAENLVYSEPLMVAPFSTEAVEIKLTFKPTQINYALINDFGANRYYKAMLVNGASQTVMQVEQSTS